MSPGLTCREGGGLKVTQNGELKPEKSLEMALLSWFSVGKEFVGLFLGILFLFISQRWQY